MVLQHLLRQAGPSPVWCGGCRGQMSVQDEMRMKFYPQASWPRKCLDYPGCVLSYNTAYGVLDCRGLYTSRPGTLLNGILWFV